jgi:molybdate transport system substrate-binding protein
MKPKKHPVIIVLIITLFTGLCLVSTAWSGSSRVIVFAAASTTDAMTEIAQTFEKSHPTRIRLSFASSSTLAKQIEQGAPADIYLSANPKWMDYLSERGAVITSSRYDLLGNRIVLISPADGGLENLTVDARLDMAGLLKGGRLAMGDPDHVPAGIYGKKALETLGLWESVKDSVARAKDVRAALALTARGEAPLGLVYATDAAITPRVKIVGLFPENSHPKIVYPIALIKEKPEANALLHFIQSEKAADIFRKYGFSCR